MSNIYNNSECWPAQFFLWVGQLVFIQFYYKTIILLKLANLKVRLFEK